MLLPDWGGVVGAPEPPAAGPPSPSFPSPAADPSKSDTAVDFPSPASQPQEPKLCVVCGKDVAGHRRLKDSRGYICYDCAKKEQRRERGDRVRCQSCGRMAKASALNNYEGSQICNACLAERKALQKQQIQRIGIVCGHK